MRFAARGLGVTEYDNLLAKSVVHRDRISSLIGISKTSCTWHEPSGKVSRVSLGVDHLGGKLDQERQKSECGLDVIKNIIVKQDFSP